MKETGLMFKAPLVRAILSGQKTQTRRLFSAHTEKLMRAAAAAGEVSHFMDEGSMPPNDLGYVLDLCPLGRPGDRIYVRETWNPDPPCDGTWGYTQWAGCRQGQIEGVPERFRSPEHCNFEASWQGSQMVWTPSIHMPKWAARIWLEITGVRVERLQDISEADADAEGCERLDFERYERDWTLCPKCGGTRLHDALGGNGGVIHDCDCIECDTYVKRFRHLWQSTGGDWAANPWVWVIDFKTISTTGRQA